MNKLQRVFKKIKRSAIFTTALFLLAMTASAQQPPHLPTAELDKMYLRFQKNHSDSRALQQMEKEIDVIVDRAAEKLQKWLAEKQKEQTVLLKNYNPRYKHSKADLNLFPIWEAMPGPAPSLPDAKQAEFSKRYQVYIDSVITMKTKFSETLQQHINQQRIEQHVILKDSKAMADKSVVVQQMGGTDALMNMSETERKLSAQIVAKSIKDSPGEFSGIKNNGMNAMTKRMMNDIQYREAYNSMTQEQKAAELKKYMGNAVEERNDGKLKAAADVKNSTLNAANIEHILSKSLQNMVDASKPYSEGTERATAFFEYQNKTLDDWYNITYASLPETVTNEKIGMNILIKYKESILYSYHKKEAATRVILWTLLKNATKIAFGEFNDLIGEYPWGESGNMQVIGMEYAEPKVAQAVTSIYDEMIRMTQDAERLTAQFKGQQEQYEIILR